VKKRLWLSLALGGVLLLAGLVTLGHRSHLASYHGRSIASWALQLSAPEQPARDEASAAFQALGTNALPELVELLQTRDPFWQKPLLSLGAKLPGRLGRKIAAKTGLSRTATLRVAAARALGGLGAQAEAATASLARAMSDPEPAVRGQAVTALCAIGKAAVPDLALVLWDKDPGVRRAAAFALGRVGAEEAVPALVFALQDKDAGVRVEAASVLARMGPQAWAAIPALTRALNDSDPSVRGYAASGLNMIGNPGVLAVVKVLNQGDTNGQKAAIKVLLQNYRSLRLSAAALRKLAQAQPPASRQQAIEALGLMRLNDELTLRTLTAALHDPAVEVRLAAIQALAGLAEKPAAVIPALSSCLEDESPPVREAAKEALRQVQPPALPHGAE
jgi:HEAT repeat protein